jgi:hypothetical protein
VSELREKLRGEIEAVDAASLLPHHRRGALLIVGAELDILEVAISIASDDAASVAELVEQGGLRRPSLSELTDWCVDVSLRFQFVILQPYVLAQPLGRPEIGAT